MDKFCLMTRLAEKPSICLYYKGMERNASVPIALNVIVAFTKEEATLFNEEDARHLCEQLNKDKQVLFEHQFLEFEVIRRANSD